jgi:hypothetical protein
MVIVAINETSAASREAGRKAKAAVMGRMVVAPGVRWV